MMDFEDFNDTDFNETLDCPWCHHDPDFDAFIRLQEYSTKVELASGILASWLSLITVTANVSLLATLWRNTSSYFRSPTMYFIIFLSVTDLVTGLVVEPIKAFCSLDFYRRNRRRTALCLTLTEKVVDIILPATANASFLIVLALSVTQYLAVGFPCRFGSLVKAKYVRISVAIAWGYAFMFSILQLPAVHSICFSRSVSLMTRELTSGPGRSHPGWSSWRPVPFLCLAGVSGS